MLSQPVTGLASSLVKALRVLLVLEDSPAGRGVSEIARELGLPKSAVHRMLVTFQQHGFVQQQPSTSRYHLGPTLARLGLRASEMFSPRQVARPYLEALGQEVGETVFLGILSPAGVLVVDKVEHGQVLRISSGTRRSPGSRRVGSLRSWISGSRKRTRRCAKSRSRT